MYKKLILTIVAAAVLMTFAAAVLNWWPFNGRGSDFSPLMGTKVDDKATMAILHSEAMSFLVTRRTTTQIVVEHSESNLIGEWKGVLWATVTWKWGVNLSKLTEKDIRRDGSVVYVHLPDPELLDFSVEPDGKGFMSRSTAVPKISELMNSGKQRDKMEAMLPEKAREFAEHRDLRPTRADMVSQVNKAMEVFKQAAGVDLRFE